MIMSGRLHVEMDDGSQLEIGPNDVFDIPPGHDGWVTGRDPMQGMYWSGVRTWIPEPETGERVLATVLFTDIVGSTETLSRIGDRAWRELLGRHNQAMRDQLDRYRGREVHTTGDGFLAVFDGPARAIRAAVGARGRIREIGLETRAGIHTGEVELVGDDVRGVRWSSRGREDCWSGRERRDPRLVHDPRPCDRRGIRVLTRRHAGARASPAFVSLVVQRRRSA